MQSQGLIPPDILIGGLNIQEISDYSAAYPPQNASHAIGHKRQPSAGEPPQEDTAASLKHQDFEHLKITNQESFNTILQKQLQEQIIANHTKDLRIQQLIDMQLKTILKGILTLISQSPTLQERLKKSIGENKEVTLDSLLQKLQQVVDGENVSFTKEIAILDNDWVGMNSEKDDLSVLLEQFGSIVQDLPKDELLNTAANNFSQELQQLTNNQPISSQENRFANAFWSCMKYMGYGAKGFGSGFLGSCKLLFFLYQQVIFIATFLGVTTLVVQSPVAGAVSIGLSFLLRKK